MLWIVFDLDTPISLLLVICLLVLLFALSVVGCLLGYSSCLVVWIPLFLDPSDGAFGRFDLAALCGCRTLNFCLFVCLLSGACRVLWQVRQVWGYLLPHWAVSRDLCTTYGVFGRFDLAALCGCRTFIFCSLVCLFMCGYSGNLRLTATLRFRGTDQSFTLNTCSCGPAWSCRGEGGSRRRQAGTCWLRVNASGST